MQELPGKLSRANQFFASVKLIANDRMADSREVRPDLMSAPGFRICLHESKSFEPFQHFIFRNGLAQFSALCSDGHALKRKVFAPARSLNRLFLLYI